MPISQLPYPILNRKRNSRLPEKNAEELEKEAAERKRIMKRLQDQKKLLEESEPKQLKKVARELISKKTRTTGDVSEEDEGDGMPSLGKTGRSEGNQVLGDYVKKKRSKAAA